jgi:hypothetical protein
MKDTMEDERSWSQQILWKWPLDLAQYNRDTILSQQEYEILDGKLASPPYRLSKSYREMLHRLVQPYRGCFADYPGCHFAEYAF